MANAGDFSLIRGSGAIWPAGTGPSNVSLNGSSAPTGGITGYHVYRDGKPLRKANGMPVTLPFSPDTTRWRRTAILDLRKLGIDV